MKKIVPFLLLLFLFSFSFNAFSIPALSSYPSAKATIFLDFDGHLVQSSIWNGGNPLVCAASGFNDAQINEVFNRVSEDYRPFNINITTDSTVFLSAPLAQRIRIIVTTTSNWYPNVGGVAYTRSFTWGDDTPGFAFVDKLNYSVKNVAECCTHESGHTLGLSHQAKYNGSCTLLSMYNSGFGSGETGWAPVMGNSYGKNFSGWNNGPTPNGCTADQDNLSIITGTNGFTYREDDHSDDADKASILLINDLKFSAEGIITTNVDNDIFKFTFAQNGRVQLEAKPFSIGANNAGANLDVKLVLLNNAKKVIGEYDPQNILNVSVDTLLAAGTYYAVVTGAGNLNTTNYGSLGLYTLSGNMKPNIIMPITQVLLAGKQLKGTHDLSWNIICDVAIKNIELESSGNGTRFNSLANLSSSDKHFDYAPLIKEDIFYRLKVTSIEGQVAYSNVISLKPIERSGELITINPLVNNEIAVNAPEDFHYQLVDMNGRIMKTGNADAGVSHINIENSPNGIYIIQIISNSQRSTGRIVKL